MVRLALALAALLAGCAGVPADLAPDPAPAADASGCRTGEGALLLASTYGDGILPAHMRPDLVEIARDGTISILKGHTEPGPGEMRAEEGALDGLTLDDAAAMLARRNLTYEEEHLVIDRGDRATLPEATYAAFCGSLLRALPGLDDEYPHAAGCGPAMTLAWDVWARDAARTIRMSDCAADAHEFEGVKRDFQRLVGPG